MKVSVLICISYFFYFQIIQGNLGRANSVENSDLVFLDWQDVDKESDLEDSGAFTVSTFPD